MAWAKPSGLRCGNPVLSKVEGVDFHSVYYDDVPTRSPSQTVLQKATPFSLTQRQATDVIEGPVSVYEYLTGEEPLLTVSEKDTQRHFCRLVWEDETRKELCFQDHEERSAGSTEPKISACWCGVHNIICPIKYSGSQLFLSGGAYLIRELRKEAEKKLEEFLESISADQKAIFRQAWNQIPEISEREALDYKAKALELAGVHYLFLLIHYRTLSGSRANELRRG